MVKDVIRIMSIRAISLADVKSPVLAVVRHNWLKMWQSLNHKGDKLREIKRNV